MATQVAVNVLHLVEESFSSWADDIAAAVQAETAPSKQIEVYARTTLELAAAGRHRIATALSGVDLGPTRRARIAELHQRLMAPLITAVAECGEDRADTTAALVQGILDSAIRLLEAGEPAEDVIPRTLAFLRAAQARPTA